MQLIRDWNLVCQNLPLDQLEIDSWFRHVSPMKMENGELILALPNQFLRDRLQIHYGHYVERTCRELFGIKQVNFIVLESAKPQNIYMPNLQKHLLFSNFVVGSCNEMAYKAALEVADHPGELYNPLFVYGDSGLGKTHLMQAIAWQIHQKSPQKKIHYLSADKFVYGYVRACKEHTLTDFKQQFYDVDIFLMDDVHLLKNKEGSQKELLATCNNLLQQRCQVILASPTNLYSLDGINNTLKSSLSAGLSTGLGACSYDLRRSILQFKCEKSQFYISDEVIELLARKLSGNIRILEGAFNRLISYHNLAGKPLTMDVVKSALQDLLYDTDQRITLADVERCVASFYGIDIDDIKSAKRSSAFNRPRQTAIYLAKILTAHSLPEIGRWFGGRTHTTVLHAFKKVDGEIKNNNSLLKEINLLKTKLQEG